MNHLPDLPTLGTPAVPPAAFAALLARIEAARPALAPLAAYHAEPGDASLVAPYLPPRLQRRLADPRKGDVVIENDIAWRLWTMTDFLVGGPVRVLSTADDPALRARIDDALDAVWEASGGLALLQDLAMLGHIFGFVDLVVRGPETRGLPADLPARIELVEPTRGLGLPSAGDWRRLAAYAARVTAETARPTQDAAAAMLRRNEPHLASDTVIELFAPGERCVIRRREGQRRPTVERRATPWTPGVPVVHIQNTSRPFRYAGTSEVKPLIALQNELCLRLSDRAHRTGLQSFKMWLAKGLDGFGEVPVGPGQVWSTDNPDATIESFGGDSASPSETQHIAEIREALDKLSGVPPLAGGVVQGRIGSLTSGAALRVTLTALLQKTARKRVLYGRGIAQASRLVLDALHHAGALDTDPSQRGVRVVWPEPLPVDDADRLAAARQKRDLGVPTSLVLAELGYARDDLGIE